MYALHCTFELAIVMRLWNNDKQQKRESTERSDDKKKTKATQEEIIRVKMETTNPKLRNESVQFGFSAIIHSVRALWLDGEHAPKFIVMERRERNLYKKCDQKKKHEEEVMEFSNWPWLDSLCDRAEKRRTEIVNKHALTGLSHAVSRLFLFHHQK